MNLRSPSVRVILAMVLVTAVGVLIIRAVDQPENAKPGPVPVPVEVARITPLEFTHELEALGTVQAVREAAVGAKVTGPVVHIPAEIELGASPRASLGVYRSAQAFAAIHGRGHVLPDDVKTVAPYVLPHRLITTAQARLRERGAREIAQEILKSVPAPVEAE